MSLKQEACKCANTNSSILHDFYGTSINGIKNSLEPNLDIKNNCKFKLKKNRKIERNNLDKIYNFLRKNPIIELNLKQEEDYSPPKAPANTTQYLSSLKTDIENEQENQQIKLVQAIAKQNIFSNRMRSNLKVNHKNSNLDWNDYFKKENSFTQNISINNIKKTMPLSLNLNDQENIDWENFHIEIENFENADILNKELLTGSTMKRIVESITKSKNKILKSNSLNLDGYQSNTKKEIMENFKNQFKNLNYVGEEKEFENAKNLVEMKFTTQDFIPDLTLDLDLFEFEYSQNQSETVSEEINLRNIGIYSNFKSAYLEKSTKSTSAENSSDESRSPTILSEDKKFVKNSFLKKHIFKNKQRKKNKNAQFFLLGSKTKTTSSTDKIVKYKKHFNNNYYSDEDF